MENKENIECSIMEEVREMRRKISAEFGHDLNRLIAYYPSVFGYSKLVLISMISTD